MKKVIIVTHDESNYQRLKALVKGIFPEVDVSLASDKWDLENSMLDKYKEDISDDLEIDPD
jgi:hypothetical protein